MSLPGTRESDVSGEVRVGLRDWILLPLIGLLTIALFAAATECVALWCFPVSEANLDTCFATDDPTGYAPVKPNSVCSERIAESRLEAQYRFNNRGDRDATDLVPKQPNTYRIVMIGSSFAMGLFVPQEKTFAGLLPGELSKQTGKTVELYNEARGGQFRGGPYPVPDSVRNFPQALAPDPDMILWILTPMDLENAVTPAPIPVPPTEPPGLRKPDEGLNRLLNLWPESQFAMGAIGDRLRHRWELTRTSVVLKQLLLQTESPDHYVTSYLENEDDAGFLRAAPNERWQALIRNMDADAAGFEHQAKAAHVPLVAVLVPNRAQAAMLSMGEWPQGYDPFKLDQELHSIVTSHGGTYVDILPDFRGVPDAEQDYFPVDGHPNPEGHALIARLIAKQLTSGAVPALQPSVDVSQTTPERKR